MKIILEELLEGGKLSRSEAYQVMENIGREKYSPEEITSLLTIFRMRPIDPEEFAGFREALYDLSNQVNLESDGSIDIVGSGGDGKCTFNISTLSSFVVAGAGYKVTKHGSYAVSSITGASNLLQKLGYEFTTDEDRLQRQLDKYNICFLHAPLFHPALKNVAPIRKSLGIRTIFNIMGPTINPSHPKAYLLGAFSPEVARLYGDVMAMTDYNFSVVHSVDGYDEVSLTDDYLHITRSGNHLRKPEEFQFSRHRQEDIFSGDTIDSARDIFVNVLKNECPEAHKNVVLINSGIAIHTLDPAVSVEEGIQKARESIESGSALENLTKLLNDQ